jgi:hypothetical protein
VNTDYIMNYVNGTHCNATNSLYYVSVLMFYVLDGLAFPIKLYRHGLYYICQKINNYDINDQMVHFFCNTYKCCNKLNLYVATNHKSSSFMVYTNTYKCCHNPSLCVATLQRLLVYVTNA